MKTQPLTFISHHSIYTYILTCMRMHIPTPNRRRSRLAVTSHTCMHTCMSMRIPSPVQSDFYHITSYHTYIHAHTHAHTCSLLMTHPRSFTTTPFISSNMRACCAGPINSPSAISTIYNFAAFPREFPDTSYTSDGESLKSSCNLASFLFDFASMEYMRSCKLSVPIRPSSADMARKGASASSCSMRASAVERDAIMSSSVVHSSSCVCAVQFLAISSSVYGVSSRFWRLWRQILKCGAEWWLWWQTSAWLVGGA
jgi:hypothetical protein